MVRRFLLLLRVRSLFTGEGSSDKVMGGFWDTPRFGDTLLGLTKLLGSRFIGFVISGLSKLPGGGGDFCLSRVLSLSPLKDPQVDPLFFLVCL